MFRIILITILIVISTLNIEAQYRKKVPPILHGLSVNAKVGTNIYCGDLVDSKRVKFSMAATADKEMMNWMSVRAELAGGVFGGVQNDIMSFTTVYFDFTVGAHVSVLDLIQGYFNDRMITPYGGIGGGLVMFSANKTTDTELSEDAAAADDWRNIKTGFKAAPVVYGMIGGRYRIDSHWGVNLEIKANLPFSDDLDGHTGWRNPHTASAENPNGEWVDGKNDFYYTILAGCTYKFHNKNWKPSSKYNRNVYLRNKKVYKKNINRSRRR